MSGYIDHIINSTQNSEISVLCLYNQIASRFLDTQARWQLSKFNHLSLRLPNANEIEVPAYEAGKVHRVKTYVRGQKRLPVYGLFAVVIAALQRGPELVRHILPVLQRHAMKSAQAGKIEPQLVVHHLLQALELMLSDGWVKGRHDRNKPGLDLTTPMEGQIIHTNLELNERLGVKVPSASPQRFKVDSVKK